MMLALVLLHMMLGLLANCVLAWSMKTIWDWFCVASVGPGPSIGAWWGIALITQVVLMSSLMGIKRSETEKSDTWMKPIALVLSCLLTLAFAWCVGTLLGWKA